MSTFHPFEVVDRGSETQPQVGESFNKLTQQDEEWKHRCHICNKGHMYIVCFISDVTISWHILQWLLVITPITLSAWYDLNTIINKLNSILKLFYITLFLLILCSIHIFISTIGLHWGIESMLVYCWITVYDFEQTSKRHKVHVSLKSCL